MNKEQAAKKLGISVRTLQRHMSRHKLGFTMRRTKTGEEAVFDKDEVQRFKEEMRGERLTATVSGVVMPETVAVSPTDDKQAEQTALAVVPRAGDAALAVASLEDEQFDKLLARMKRMAAVSRAKPSAADLATKHFLTLDEAASLSGLSSHQLRAAISDNKLKAKIIGRGWKIRPKDLQSYTDKL
jgi:excisionase family DNA binding protein